MKKGARIVNVARGGVIDDHALARALDAKIVAAAGGVTRLCSASSRSLSPSHSDQP